mmetsp:Transcript_2179/g.2987  ORF Transcript_2179/g.2987 Transcript_2179/m.2987 type:complete len:165 (+) Transcript_2179:352-846(+)
MMEAEPNVQLNISDNGLEKAVENDFEEAERILATMFEDSDWVQHGCYSFAYTETAQPDLNSSFFNSTEFSSFYTSDLSSSTEMEFVQKLDDQDVFWLLFAGGALILAVMVCCGLLVYRCWCKKGPDHILPDTFEPLGEATNVFSRTRVTHHQRRQNPYTLATAI